MTKPGDAPPVGSPLTKPRSERGQATRAQILEVAKRHLARSGYRGTATAAIAEEVGISDPGLLHHFKSKNGLLMAILEARYGHDESTFAFASMDAGALFDRLEEIIRENEGSRVDVLLYSVLLAESLDEGQASHEWFADRFARVRRLIAEPLREGQARGTVRADIDVDGFAAMIVAAMDGLQYQWMLDPSLSMVDSFRALTTVLRSTLSP